MDSLSYSSSTCIGPLYRELSFVLQDYLNVLFLLILVTLYKIEINSSLTIIFNQHSSIRTFYSKHFLQILLFTASMFVNFFQCNIMVTISHTFTLMKHHIKFYKKPWTILLIQQRRTKHNIAGNYNMLLKEKYTLPCMLILHQQRIRIQMNSYSGPSRERVKPDLSLVPC